MLLVLHLQDRLLVYDHFVQYPVFDSISSYFGLNSSPCNFYMALKNLNSK